MSSNKNNYFAVWKSHSKSVLNTISIRILYNIINKLISSLPTNFLDLIFYIFTYRKVKIIKIRNMVFMIVIRHIYTILSITIFVVNYYVYSYN